MLVAPDKIGGKKTKNVLRTPTGFKNVENIN